jgi:hypothetical protein
MKIKLKELLFFSGLKSIDSISTASYSDEIYLHNGRHVGMYIPGHGVVLEPIYAGIQRFKDILKVEIKGEQDFLLCGGYSINKKEFVIPPIYTDREFWKQLSDYNKIWHPIPPFRRIWG